MDNFILGMFIAWVICGFIAVLCNTLNIDEDIKDCVIGGFWWLPIIKITQIISNNFRDHV